MQKILLDTNIYLDFYLDRKDGIKPLGEFAFNLIKRTISCEFEIILLKEIFFELKTVLGIKDANLENIIFNELRRKNKIANICSNEKQEKDCLLLSNQFNIPKTDALIAIMARDEKALIISRDKHFDLLKHIANYVTPEEL